MTGEGGMTITLPIALQFVQLIAIVAGGGMVSFRIGRATSRMETMVEQQAKEITGLKDEIKKLGEILTQLALADQRMNMMQQQIDELRHGEGMVLPLRKGAYEK